MSPTNHDLLLLLSSVLVLGRVMGCCPLLQCVMGYTMTSSLCGHMNTSRRSEEEICKSRIINTISHTPKTTIKFFFLDITDETSPKTYIMKNDGSVIKGPNLPEEVFGHCQVSHDNLVFIIGKFYFA